MGERENCVKLIRSPAAIMEACLDFGEGAEHAAKYLTAVTGLSDRDSKWQGTCLRFLTENIHPEIKSPTRARVMLLFSNPHPESVNKGLFMSEKHSRGFWVILCPKLGINNHIRWDDNESIQEMVTLLMDGNYEGPLLFFECLYQIPSRSPEDLKKLFKRGTDHFIRYLHKPSLKRIKDVISNNSIKTILVFTGDTFESIVGNPGISKNSRQVLRSAVQNAEKDSQVFLAHLNQNKLMQKVPDLKHDCIAMKVMDTRAKSWWKKEGSSVFSRVLGYALKYASSVEQ